jgi:hypothetical protein
MEYSIVVRSSRFIVATFDTLKEAEIALNYIQSAAIDGPSLHIISTVVS